MASSTIVPTHADVVMSRHDSAQPRPASNWLLRLGPGSARTTGWDESWLDGVRACAVLTVVAYHVWYAAGTPPIHLGSWNLTWIPTTLGVGVTIFFLLSGYLLSRPWFVAELTGRPKPGKRAFWWRRLLRIVPAYYLSIAVVLILFVPSGRIPAGAVQGDLGVANLGGQLLFLQGYSPISSSNLNHINGPYWTLSVEMTLYLLLPLAVVAFLRRRAWFAVPAAFALAMGWTYLALNGFDSVVRKMVSSIEGPRSGYLWVPATEAQMRALLIVAFPSWVFTFALGIALARVSAHHELRSAVGTGPAWWQRRSTAYLALALGLAVLTYGQYKIGTAALALTTRKLWTIYLPHIVPSLGLALILFGLTVGPKAARRPLAWLPMRFVGWTSYGIYLYHVPIIFFLEAHTNVKRFGPNGQFFAFLSSVLVFSIAAGTASWLLIERPLLRRRRAEPDQAAPRPRSTSRLPARAWVPVAAIVALTGGVAGAVVASASNTTDLRATTDGLFAKSLPDVRVDAKLSGEHTLDEALTAGLMYPREGALVRGCTPGPGRTTLLVAPMWSVSATAFPCADPAAAQAVLGQITDWEAEIGFAPVTGHPADVHVFFRDVSPPTPTHPNQFHVRFRAGQWIVGFAVQARTRAAGDAAVETLLGALDSNYQPR